MGEEMDMSISYSRGWGDILRWTAPELFAPDGRLTPASDIFSLAMTILELITGERPFREVTRSTQALFLLAQGSRPVRPNGEKPETLRVLTDPLWYLVEDCWKHNPGDRIDIQAFLERIAHLLVDEPETALGTG